MGQIKTVQGPLGAPYAIKTKLGTCLSMDMTKEDVEHGSNPIDQGDHVHKTTLQKNHDVQEDCVINSASLFTVDHKPLKLSNLV